MTTHTSLPRPLTLACLALLVTAMEPVALEAQLKVGPHLSMRPATLEVEEVSVAEFARSLRVRTETGEPVAATCMAAVYDSEGNAWGAFAADEAVRVGVGEEAGCWSMELMEMLPEGRFGPNDRVLSPGLIVNAEFLTAHSLPVTADVPVDPFLLSDELRFSTPRFESSMEEVGRPLEEAFGMESRAEWVAISFMMIPMTERRHIEEGGDEFGEEASQEFSEEFESMPVTVLLGARER